MARERCQPTGLRGDEHCWQLVSAAVYLALLMHYPLGLVLEVGRAKPCGNGSEEKLGKGVDGFG